MAIAHSDPGSIWNQIGYSLNAIRDAVERQDVYLIAAHVELLVEIASPRLTEHERKELEIPPVPGGRDRDGSQAHEFSRKCMRLVGQTLRILSKRGLYAKMAPPVKDGRGYALGAESPGAGSPNQDEELEEMWA